MLELLVYKRLFQIQNLLHYNTYKINNSTRNQTLQLERSKSGLARLFQPIIYYVMDRHLVRQRIQNYFQYYKVTYYQT